MSLVNHNVPGSAELVELPHTGHTFEHYASQQSAFEGRQLPLMRASGNGSPTGSPGISSNRHLELAKSDGNSDDVLMQGPSRRVAAILSPLLLLLMVLPAVSSSADQPANDIYLNGLLGSWRMEGTVGKKPVRYQASGTRVLRGGFLRLHMLDVARPPQYEADLFIGFDAKAHDFVAHWIDQFGAAGARVVGTGQRDGDRLVVLFPYVEGAFRDTFTRDSADDSWQLLLESQEKSGSWSTFASYVLTRPHKH